MGLGLITNNPLNDGTLVNFSLKLVTSKLIFYFAIALSFLSTLIVISEKSSLSQMSWLMITPVLACAIFLPDLLDFLAYGFFPHHPWTHHPLSIIYFIPLLIVVSSLGIDNRIILAIAICWVIHILLDITGLGIPILWKPVRWNHPLRSYKFPIINQKGILRLPWTYFNSFVVQLLGIVIGLGWYLVLLVLVVI